MRKRLLIIAMANTEVQRSWKERSESRADGILYDVVDVDRDSPVFLRRVLYIHVIQARAIRFTSTSALRGSINSCYSTN